MKKLFLTLALVPVLVFAQTETNATATIPALGIVPDQSASSVVGTTSPQEGTTSQESIPATVLEGAVNPQQNVSTSISSTSTSEQLPLTPEVIAPIPTVVSTTTASTTEEVVETLEPALEEVVLIAPEELTIKKEYAFALSGESIATKENTEWNKDKVTSVDTAKTITSTPAFDVSDANALNISGACTYPYFVVLLYRHPQDYDQNPSSYIFNKAYPCFNGQYSYSISELPFNLSSGTFYLLVGGQGETGSWKPISALTPVGITVTTTLVNASGTPVNEPAP